MASTSVGHDAAVPVALPAGLQLALDNTCERDRRVRDAGMLSLSHIITDLISKHTAKSSSATIDSAATADSQLHNLPALFENVLFPALLLHLSHTSDVIRERTLTLLLSLLAVLTPSHDVATALLHASALALGANIGLPPCPLYTATIAAGKNPSAGVFNSAADPSDHARLLFVDVISVIIARAPAAAVAAATTTTAALAKALADAPDTIVRASAATSTFVALTRTAAVNNNSGSVTMMPLPQVRPSLLATHTTTLTAALTPALRHAHARIRAAAAAALSVTTSAAVAAAALTAAEEADTVHYNTSNASASANALALGPAVAAVTACLASVSAAAAAASAAAASVLSPSISIPSDSAESKAAETETEGSASALQCLRVVCSRPPDSVTTAWAALSALRSDRAATVRTTAAAAAGAQLRLWEHLSQAAAAAQSQAAPVRAVMMPAQLLSLVRMFLALATSDDNNNNITTSSSSTSGAVIEVETVTASVTVSGTATVGAVAIYELVATAFYQQHAQSKCGDSASKSNKDHSSSDSVLGSFFRSDYLPLSIAYLPVSAASILSKYLSPLLPAILTGPTAHSKLATSSTATASSAASVDSGALVTVSIGGGPIGVASATVGTGVAAAVEEEGGLLRAVLDWAEAPRTAATAALWACLALACTPPQQQGTDRDAEPESESGGDCALARLPLPLLAHVLATLTTAMTTSTTHSTTANTNSAASAGASAGAGATPAAAAASTTGAMLWRVLCLIGAALPPSVWLASTPAAASPAGALAFTVATSAAQRNRFAANDDANCDNGGEAGVDGAGAAAASQSSVAVFSFITALVPLITGALTQSNTNTKTNFSSTGIVVAPATIVSLLRALDRPDVTGPAAPRALRNVTLRTVRLLLTLGLRTVPGDGSVGTPSDSARGLVAAGESVVSGGLVKTAQIDLVGELVLLTLKLGAKVPSKALTTVLAPVALGAQAQKDVYAVANGDDAEAEADARSMVAVLATISHFKSLLGDKGSGDARASQREDVAYLCCHYIRPLLSRLTVTIGVAANNTSFGANTDDADDGFIGDNVSTPLPTTNLTRNAVEEEHLARLQQLLRESRPLATREQLDAAPLAAAAADAAFLLLALAAASGVLLPLTLGTLNNTSGNNDANIASQILEDESSVVIVNALSALAGPKNALSLRARALLVVVSLFTDNTNGSSSGASGVQQRVLVSDYTHSVAEGVWTGLLRGCLLPSLVWQPGLGNEAIRLLAVSALNAVLHCRDYNYTGASASNFQSIDDDSDSVSAKPLPLGLVLHNVPVSADADPSANIAGSAGVRTSATLAFPASVLSAALPRLLPALLSCSDDDAPSVRLNAGQCLQLVFSRLNPATATVSEAEVNETYQTLVKRLDDADVSTQVTYMHTLAVFLGRCVYRWPQYAIANREDVSAYSAAYCAPVTSATDPHLQTSSNNSSSSSLPADGAGSSATSNAAAGGLGAGLGCPWDFDAVHATYITTPLAAQLGAPVAALRTGAWRLLTEVLTPRHPSAVAKELGRLRSQGRDDAACEAARQWALKVGNAARHAFGAAGGAGSLEDFQ